MFEITMLGTSSAVPTVQRNLSSVAIRKNGDILLFDCGEGTQRQMMKYGLSYMGIRAIFISHMHLDHFLGVFGIVETMRLNNRQTELAIYVPAGSANAFTKKHFTKIIEYKPGLVAEFEGFSISAFKTSHSINSFGFVLQEKDRRRFYEKKAKSLGVRGPLFSKLSKQGKIKIGKKTIKLEDVTYLQKGKKIVYTGDTAPCLDVKKAAKQADLLIHEATFCEDKKEDAAQAKHSTAFRAAKTAASAKAKLLLLTHISGRYRDEKQILTEAKKAFKNAKVAYDGMKLGV